MDKIKYFIFFFIVAVVSVYPLLESKNQPKIKEYKNKKIIPTVIENGKYYIYEVNLTKEGSFKRLELYSQQKIKAYDFLLKNKITKEKLFSKTAIYKKPILKGIDVKYINNEYNLITKNAIYNQNKKTLKGGEFELYSVNYKGYGKSFFVDENKNIYAKDIKYFIKVDR
jgi:hypothetical protein